jgi:hypothetical protein
MSRPYVYSSVADLVDDTLRSVGPAITMAMPIGAGQPVHLANEFYRRAKADPHIRLKLLTGLSLEPPRPKTELERRFWEPIIGRLYAGVPSPHYISDARASRLPDNVQLVEYYVRPGAFLNVPEIQQNYCSSNYTHIARDMDDAGANVGAAQIAQRSMDGELRYSISSNASASLDLIRRMQARRQKGEKLELIGVINSYMPFMYGTSVKEPQMADRVLDDPTLYHPLFCTLREAISPAEAMIGLYASALVRDGGTLQIGIGGIGEAIGEALIMRRRRFSDWCGALESSGAIARFGEAIRKIGGCDNLPLGLYGCTEMMTYPFVRLMEAGIISREVYDWLPLQTLAAAGLEQGKKVTPKLFERLLADERLHVHLRKEEVDTLRRFGILKSGCRWVTGEIECDGERFNPDMSDPIAFARLTMRCLGETLFGGVLIHAGFFMGPQPFYQALADMPDARRAAISMRAISHVNQLYGSEDLKRLQRRDARFFNTAMMLTVLGAAASDMLEAGQMVSGVGGQYNFVSMAHALEDGRSVLMARATREKPTGASSNVLWSYGHTTIPRHLRDVYVTEYGIADVRGQTDCEIIKAMLAITDSRFQEPLMETAKRNGKLPADYRIPDCHRENTPKRVEDDIARLRTQGLLPAFPTGSDFSEEETRLLAAMRTPAAVSSDIAEETLLAGLSPENSRCLTRMRLDNPKTDEERALRLQLAHALASTNS